VVYCTKCGAENKDDSQYCSKCGATFAPKNLEARVEDFGRRAEEWGEEIGRRAESWGEHTGKRMEKECFGLPHGGTIIGIIFGLLIIIVGLGMIYGWNLNIGAYVIIIIGVLIAVSAVYNLARRSSR
jgi:hypothetical protein